jgi:adenylate cyclase
MTAEHGLSALTRERLLRFWRILALSGLVSAIYGMRVGSSPSPAIDGLIGIVDGVLIAGCIAGIEIFALRTGPLREISRLPFALVLALKSLVYGAIVVGVLVAQPGERLAGVSTLYDASDLARTVGFSLVVATTFIVLFQAAGLVGYRTFRHLLLGRYRLPRLERRFFLFIDVVGSTALAERLGPLPAHQFLSRVFTLAAEPIAACQGEIYQYVGDEIVVTWTERDGSLEGRPVRCFFEVRAALAVRAKRFRDRFGVQPELRAALHLGEVTVGEVGQERRAIVFHGDVMNTTARLEQATREIDCRFIASAEALSALGPLSNIALRDLGALTLRGRREPLHAFAVDEQRGRSYL